MTRADAPLDEDEVAGFISRGFVQVRQAFSATLADDLPRRDVGAAWPLTGSTGRVEAAGDPARLAEGIVLP